jgi:hypothetical protein
MPTNYTLKRRIGWFKTASSNIVTFQQQGDNFFWMTKKVEINAGTPASTNRILTTVNCPVNTVGFFSYISNTTTNAYYFDSGWTALTDAAASAINSLFRSIATSAASPWGSGQYRAIVDASNQIYYRVDAVTSNALTLQTLGWTDTRSLA